MNENRNSGLIRDFRFVLGAIALCSVIGFFEFFFPILDLFNHFRIQAIVGTLVCMFLFLVWKSKIMAYISCAVLLLNVGVVGLKLYQTGGIEPLHEDEKASFSIVSANVLTSNENSELLLNLIDKENPDLVILSEVNSRWIEALKPLEERYEYTLKHPRPDNFGIAAYSKRSFKGEIAVSGDAELPVAVLQYDDIIVIGAHPLPPISNRNMSENRIYLSDIAFLAKSFQKPIVVAGDLNATLWSATLSPLIDAGFDRINPLGIAYTWPKGNILYALQIDHFFAKNIKAANFKKLPSVDSDHYPIRADIRL